MWIGIRLDALNRKIKRDAFTGCVDLIHKRLEKCRLAGLPCGMYGEELLPLNQAHDSGYARRGRKHVVLGRIAWPRYVEKLFHVRKYTIFQLSFARAKYTKSARSQWMLPREGCDFFFGAFLCIFGELSSLNVFTGVITSLTERNLSFFYLSAGGFDNFLTALLGKWRNWYADDATIVRRIKAEALIGADCGATEIVEAFLNKLLELEILIAGGDSVPEAAVQLDSLPNDTMPELGCEGFNDVADLLLMDPIHEVDEDAGWPNKRSE